MCVLINDLLHLDSEKQIQNQCINFMRNMRYLEVAVGILAQVFIMSLLILYTLKY